MENHYDDVIMSTIASQITSLTIVYSTVYSDADQRKHQSAQRASNAENVSIWWRHHADSVPNHTQKQIKQKSSMNINKINRHIHIPRWTHFNHFIHIYLFSFLAKIRKLFSTRNVRSHHLVTIFNDVIRFQNRIKINEQINKITIDSQWNYEKIIVFPSLYLLMARHC